MDEIEFLYHGTDRRHLEEIRDHGLDPLRSREPGFRARAIYLSNDPGHAAVYGFKEDGEAVLLRVRAANLDKDRLAPDDCDLPDICGEEWQNMSPLESLRESGQCRYLVPIPARLIEVAFLSQMPRDALGVALFEDGEWRSLEDIACETSHEPG